KRRPLLPGHFSLAAVDRAIGASSNPVGSLFFLGLNFLFFERIFLVDDILGAVTEKPPLAWDLLAS
ncbi:MAG: hypothetical protein DMG06_24420, partial [Acidobacteria bacterium]